MFPCNCRPPFPRPEPFSPLPRPGKAPDWGKWIRDRLAEKGALLAFPSASAFPSAGDGSNLYLAEDTGVLYRWDGKAYAVLFDPSASDVETYPGRSAFPDTGRAGAIYIDASANLLYRWDGTGYVLLTPDLSGVESRLAGVESKVPAQATAQNQLADKAFVNSSIATNTAFYISDNGRPFQSLADLESYEGALTNNDYAFVVGRDAAGNTTYTRYKWNEATEAWGEEYVLNNSSFTAEQWAAINSGITSGLVAKLGALPTAEALVQALAGKQDALTFDNAPTSGSNNPVKSSGIWAAIWGALAALPAGFSSLYDWVVAQLAGKASKADATLNERGFSEWTVTATNPAVPGPYSLIWNANQSSWEFYSGSMIFGAVYNSSATAVSVTLTQAESTYVATREQLPGYRLGPDDPSNPNHDKPLASEVEAEALRTSLSSLSSRVDIKADMSDTVLSERGLGEWICEPATYEGKEVYLEWSGEYGWTLVARDYGGIGISQGDAESTRLEWPADETLVGIAVVATRERLPGFVLGSQDDKPLASEAEAAANRAAISTLNDTKADKPATFTAGNLAALDANGNPTDSTIPAANVALKGEIPYSLGTPITIATASSEVVEGETVYYGSVTLADRTANIVQVTAATPLDELRITFPAATSGKVRDFGLRVEIGTGSAALAAPALAPISPTGETINIEENVDGSAALADGTATAKGVTLLYFSETAPGVFVVEAEQVLEVA